jgi:nucleotide-binding universal stress UspA family protein
MRSSTLRTVLAGTDLSDGSDAAVGSAAALAGAGGASLQVLHCVPRPVLPYWRGGIDEETRDRWMDAARDRLGEQLDRVLGDQAHAVTPVVLLGPPSREITSHAVAASADVIVLGPHRPRVVLDDLLGTTADRVLRTSSTPCLLAHVPLTAPVTRLLVATDFSPHAHRALETALDWFAFQGKSGGASSTSGLHVDLLHVYDIGSPIYRPFNAESLLARQIEEVRSRLPEHTDVTFHPRTLSAPLAAEGLATAVERFPSDLLVLGTHGHGFMARALLGSLASAVARTVQHPLLFVPPRRRIAPGGDAPEND